MNKVDQYREALRTLEDWDSFLLRESGLPGKRANLELAQAVADKGSEELFERYLAFDPKCPGEFSARVLGLLWCGWIGEASR